MFEELPKEKYKEIIHLYDDSRFVNSIRSHLERTPISKIVFVDNVDDPKTAAIIVQHRSFLGGKSDNRHFNEELY